MSLLERVRDRVAVALHGGVRVRLCEDGRGVVVGRTPGPPPERLLSLVRELATSPDGPGTVDLRHDGHGRWWIRGAGALAGPRFEQRLRNVLGNR